MKKQRERILQFLKEYYKEHTPQPPISKNKKINLKKAEVS
jgi:hypothetical protein